MIEYFFYCLVLPLLLWAIILKSLYFKQAILFLAGYGIASYLLNSIGRLELFGEIIFAVIFFVATKGFVKKDLQIFLDKTKIFLVCFLVLVSLAGFDFQRYWSQTNYEIVRQTYIDAKVPDFQPTTQRSTALDSKLLWFFGENIFDVFGFENKTALLLVNYFFLIGFLILLFHWLEELKISPVFCLPFFVFWQELLLIFGSFQEEALIAFFSLCVFYSIHKKDYLLLFLSFSLGIMSKRIFILLLPIILAYLATKNKKFSILLLALSIALVLLVPGALTSISSPFPQISLEKIPFSFFFVLINAVPALFYFYSIIREKEAWKKDKKTFFFCLAAILLFTVFELKYFVTAWYLQRYLTLFSGLFIVAAAQQAQKKPSLFFEFFFLWGASKIFLLGKEIMLY